MSADVIDSPMLSRAVRTALLRLADHEDAIATEEAMRVPYWAPCPNSVIGHREAARVLRADADRLLSEGAQR